MKKQISIVIVLSTLLLSACYEQGYFNEMRGSGKIVREDRPVQGVRGVALSFTGDLTIEQGEQESLSIEAEDNLLPYIDSRVSGGLLTIQTRSNADLQPTRPIHYYLTVKSLEALIVSSSGNIEVPAVQTGNLTVKISSSGNIQVGSLSADRIEVQISSSGNLQIAGGQVKEQRITISSSGEYQAGDLQSQSADVRLSSSGEATLWVTDSLNATLSSSGNVNYFGNPAITSRLSSSGELVSLGNK